MELAPDITADDLKVFLEEAEEQFQVLDEDILRLEQEGDNEELLQEIFRAAHTLKGSSAMVGHAQMAELAHSMENLLDKVRKGTLWPSSAVIDALLHSLDGLRALNEQLTSEDAAAVNIDGMVAELAVVMEGGDASTAGKAEEKKGITLDDEAKEKMQTALLAGSNTYRIEITLEKESMLSAVRCFQVMTELANATEVITSLPTLKEIMEEEDKVGHTLEVVVAGSQETGDIDGIIKTVDEVESVSISNFSMEEAEAIENKSEEQQPEAKAETKEEASQDQAAGKAEQKSPAVQAHQSQTVRIDVERLDEMMNMIGELVISSSRTMQLGKTLEVRYGSDDTVLELGRSSTMTSKVVSELQEDIMKIRMLPVGTVFTTFPRMIRDLAQKSKKKVDFIVEGQDTGIDRTVIEHIRDPLVHLLRNAVDHGIETMEDRKAVGKPEAATLILSAFHEEGHIFITVVDDGKGIDANAVKQSAVSKGIMSADDAAKLTEDESIDLIFGSGLSTKEQATEVSGRGVGLDIVRKNIEALNGYVAVETKVGSGTKFILRLPLTLATLDSLLITSNEALYALPIVNVLETVRLFPYEISTVGAREVIRLRGGVLPLLRLNDVLSIGNDKASLTDRLPVVIVRAGDKLVGIAVDTLVEKQEIVVKSMGAHVGDVKGISGASILGDGRVALIIDVPSLIASVIQQASRV